MPELPEVEAVRRALAPVMEKARFAEVVTRRANLRFPFPPRFCARLEGKTVRDLSRRGKYLVATLSSGETLIMHLGMSGSFRVDAPPVKGTPGAFHHERGAPGTHDHVIFTMSSGAVVTFNDPRRFGFMDLTGRKGATVYPALEALGPEPLEPEFDAAALARACARRTTSLKAALSDQRVVAGLGNIYVCEALHRARLSPRRRASTIATSTGAPREAATRLVAAIRKVLNDAIKRSLAWQQHEQGGGETAYFPHRFRVYDREGERCVTADCPGTIRRIVQAGRSTFFCPTCQA